MTADLITPAGVADILDVSQKKVMEWRRVYGWPCVKIGRTFRFTGPQVEQIIAKHSQLPAESPAAVAIAGQTARSASRKSKAS